MNADKDAYGIQALAYYNREQPFEIVERSDGYTDLSGGAQEYFKEFEDWPKIQQEAIKHVKGKVLDVGAGAGRASLYLQHKGFEVLALDNSPLSIDICKKRGVKNTIVLSFKDIEKLQPAKFDSILMYGNNFGLFESYDTAKSLLEKLHSITNARAFIIAESNDPHQTDAPAHLTYQEENKKRGRLPGQLTIRLRYKQYIGEWFEYLLVSEGEMRNILDGTGWRLKETIQDEGSAYVAIIEKVN